MYDKSILAKSTGASLGVVAVVGMLFLSTGTAFAIPISGIGGFTINANEIRGDNLLLYPGTSDASNITQYPTGVVELTAVEIDGLRLTKEFSGLPGAPNAGAKLVITGSGTATADTLLLKTPQLQADDSEFNGLVIDESSTGGLSEIIQLSSNDAGTVSGKSISLDGGAGDTLAGSGRPAGIVLTNPQIQGVYLATNQINIPDLNLEVQADLNGDGAYEYQ